MARIGMRQIGMTLAFAGAICLVNWQLASADEAKASVFFEQRTSSEIHDFVAQGHTTILIPIGGTEQTGPYVVVGKHNIRVKALCQLIAEKLGDALVAPVIAYVPEGNITPPSSHMRFDGTISIPNAAFEAMLEGAAQSLAAHGFKHIVFLGDHGGYQTALRAVVAKLALKWGSAQNSPQALYISQFHGTVGGEFAKTLRDHGLTQAQIGTHGGVSDTSLLLAIDPGGVRTQKLATSPPPGGAEGVYGDPRHASAALGQLGIDEIVRATVTSIRLAIKKTALKP